MSYAKILKDSIPPKWQDIEQKFKDQDGPISFVDILNGRFKFIFENLDKYDFEENERKYILGQAFLYMVQNSVYDTKPQKEQEEIKFALRQFPKDFKVKYDSNGMIEKFMIFKKVYKNKELDEYQEWANDICQEYDYF